MSRRLGVDERITLRTLERTKEGCGEAFRLISSDTARTEGFFRRAKPMTEIFPVLKQRTSEVVWTEDGVGISKVEQFGRGRCAISLLHQSFSVSAIITKSLDDFGFGVDSDIGFEIPNIYMEGLVIADQRVRGYRFQLQPVGTTRKIFLNAEFDAREMSLDELILSRISGETRGKALIDRIKVRCSFEPRLISEVYRDLIRFYPEKNYEMARIALNLLAEFEAMLDSAIRHLGGGIRN